MVYQKDSQYYKFCAYGFFKNLRFFDPFLMLFFIEKGLTYTEIGTLYAIREISINLFEVPSGIIADVMGRKKAMVFSFLAYIFSFFLFFILSDFIGFILAFIVYGVGDAFRTGTHKAMILSYLKAKDWEDYKTSYYGRTRSWSQRGSAWASIISSSIVFYTGHYDYIFLFSILPYVIDLLLMLSYPSYLNGQRALNDQSIFELFKSHFTDLKVAFSKWKPFKLIVSTSSYTGYYKSMKDYLQPLLVTLALTLPFGTELEEPQKVAVAIGVIYSLLYFINARMSRSAHLVELKFKSVASALSFVQAVGWSGGVLAGIAYVMGWTTIAIVCFTLVLLVQNLRRPMAIKYVSDQFDEKIMATVLSAESQSETLFAAIFAIAIGFLVDLLGIGEGIALFSILLLLSYSVIARLNLK